MVRKIDDLGRVVIPAETRRLFNIREGDQLAISVEGESILLRKMETPVAVGEYLFEVSRDDYERWVKRVVEELGSAEAADITAEIRRRLGF